MAAHRLSTGFTLIEMIMAIVITGIIAGIVAVFIARPVEGYVASERRAAMSDVADLALKRMELDLRSAVPNSIRLRSTAAAGLSACTAAAGNDCYLEYLPAASGGRYCTDTEACPGGATGALDFNAANDSFDVLGPAHEIADGDYLVIYNTGQAGLDLWAGDNIRQVSAHTAGRLTFSGAKFPLASPANRFQSVAAAGPVSFACQNIGSSGNTGSGSLRRAGAYATGLPFGLTQPLANGGALLADTLTACSINYDTLAANDGLISVNLSLQREGESVNLMVQIHVDNIP